jgi:hypothetical protein
MLSVAFISAARNLVPGDSNEVLDVFLTFTDLQADSGSKLAKMDIDEDGDVDGSDIELFAQGFMAGRLYSIDLNQLAEDCGVTNP